MHSPDNKPPDKDGAEQIRISVSAENMHSYLKVSGRSAGKYGYQDGVTAGNERHESAVQLDNYQ